MRKLAAVVMGAAVACLALTAPAALAKYAKRTPMQCSADYEANKDEITKQGLTRKQYMENCRNGVMPGDPAASANDHY